MKERIAIVDVETTPIRPGYIPRTKFWGIAIENGPYRRYKTFESLAKELVKHAGKLRCYYHHDYEITQMLVEGYTPHSMRARGSRIIRAQIAGQQWINSYALFPSPLAEILETAGYEKHPLNAPGHEEQCSCGECLTALEKRNHSDTVEALVAFRKINDAYARAFGVDPFAEGLATSASASFRASEAIAGVLPVDLEWRDAYRGGRTEAFEINKTSLADSWDINSSYPYAFTDAPKTDELIRARVTVKASHVSPFFRYAPADKKYGFLFPSGTYETLFFRSNYEKYIQPYTGGVVRNIEPIERIPVDLGWITRVAPLMKHAYSLRAHAKKVGDEPLSFALKIGMNATYGRVGMKAEREICSIKDRIPEDCSHYDLPNGRHLIFQNYYMSGTKANYPLAGWITDNARARLFAGLANSSPIYCDTDSNYCKPGSFTPPPGAPGPKELGGWDYKGQKPMRVRTVKDYRWGKEIVRKGGKPLCLSCYAKPADCKCGNKNIVFGGTQWTIKKALPNKKGKKKGVTLVVKTRKTEYDKREIWPDGSTTPLIVYE